MTKKEVQSIWQEHRSYIVNVLGIFGFIALFLFWLPPLLSFTWHYLSCFFLVLVSYLCKKLGKQKLVVGIAAIVLLIAVAGFFLIYFGPFVESNKSFYEYLTKYGVSAPFLSLFSPASPSGLHFGSQKHNSRRTDPGQSRTQT